MDHRQRTVLASACVVGLFLIVQLGALALVEPFQQEGHQFVEDTEDPSLSIFYIAAILVITALMLAAFKYGGASIIRLIIIFASVYIAYFVFQVLVPAYVTIVIDGAAVDVVAVGAAVTLGGALYVYPEWYVIDAAGIVLGIGAAGLFGINLNILPVLVLLVLLAIYDAISVYRTEHMLTLASGAMEIRVPVVFVVPLSLSYSFIEDGGPMTDAADDVDDTDASGEMQPELDRNRLEELGPAGVADLEPSRLAAVDPETIEELDEDLAASVRDNLPKRDALFIGLGDAVMPTILVASAAFFVGGPAISFLGITINAPALGAMVGTLFGLVVLMWLVTKGRAHAGLPLLNGGAIAGYLVGALLSGISLVEALGLGSIF